MLGQLKDLTRSRSGEWVISFSTPEDFSAEFDSLSGKQINVEIKRATRKRSKTANDFCWALCTDIGNAIKPPIPKEEVYRKAIRDVGEYEPLPIREERREQVGLLM